MHHHNPHCPTMHFNYRYFETNGGIWWFGGRTDIIPSYLDLDDIKHFQDTYKEECNRHDPELDPKFKVWADRFFIISYQDETRGLGRIFFDDLNDRNPCLLFKFAKDAVNSVVPEYGPDRRSAQGGPVHGAGEGVAADAPRTVRGVQPCVRLRDGVWAQGWGDDREYLDESARDGTVGVRSQAGAGESGGGHHGRVRAPSQVGVGRDRRVECGQGMIGEGGRSETLRGSERGMGQTERWTSGGWNDSMSTFETVL
ncbi:hypothetical protein ACHAWF_006983 [Thalassiosira exigua]